MKKVHFILVAATASILTACGSSDSDQVPMAGKYKPEVKLTQLEMKGIPKAALDQSQKQMEQMMAAQAGAEQCIGDDPNRGWKKIPESIAKGIGGKCETLKDNNTEISVDTQVKCTGARFGDVTVTMTGGAEKESYSVDIKMDLENIPGASTGTLSLNASAKRVGDCD